MPREGSDGDLEGNGEGGSIDWCTYYKLRYIYTRGYGVRTGGNKGEHVTTRGNVERTKEGRVRRDMAPKEHADKRDMASTKEQREKHRSRGKTKERTRRQKGGSKGSSGLKGNYTRKSDQASWPGTVGIGPFSGLEYVQNIIQLDKIFSQYSDQENH